jgi:hypothetical protein
MWCTHSLFVQIKDKSLLAFFYYRMRNVFHVSLVKACRPGRLLSKVPPLAYVQQEGGEVGPIPERVLSARGPASKPQYLKFAGS